MTGALTWWMLAGAGVLVVAAALVIVAARARRAGRGDVTSAGITLAVAVVSAAIAVIGGIVAATATLLQPEVAITIPVREFWPPLPEGTEIEGATAMRAGGGFTSATIVASGLSLGARVRWAIGQALAWFVPGAVAALVAMACLQLRRGRPFAPVLARLTMVVAVVVAVGGTAAQVLGDVAGSMASHELLAWTGAQWTGDVGPETLLPSPTLLIELPFWPIGAGLGLAALAAVLRQGDRLARDTEGLV